MGMAPQEKADRMVQLLNLKYAVMKDIFNITKAQAESISEEGIGGLGRLIELKQDKIAEIDSIDAEFAGCFESFKKLAGIERMEQLSGDKRIKGLDVLKSVTAEVIKLTENIKAQEEKNSSNVNALLKTMGDKARKFNQGKWVSSAYTARYNENKPSYIDKKK